MCREKWARILLLSLSHPPRESCMAIRGQDSVTYITGHMQAAKFLKFMGIFILWKWDPCLQASKHTELTFQNRSFLLSNRNLSLSADKHFEHFYISKVHNSGTAYFFSLKKRRKVQKQFRILVLNFLFDDFDDKNFCHIHPSRHTIDKKSFSYLHNT